MFPCCPKLSTPRGMSPYKAEGFLYTKKLPRDTRRRTAFYFLFVFSLSGSGFPRAGFRVLGPFKGSVGKV